MAEVNAYATAEQLRTYLRDGAGNLTTELLERAVNSASRAIDRFCGRRFWQDSGTAVRTYVVDHPRYAFVDDISTRTGLVVKTGTDGVTFDTTLTIDDDFILEPRNADQYDTATFGAFAFWKIQMVDATLPVDAHGRPTLQVTARHGWSAIPVEVEGACLIKAASLFKRKDAPFGVAGVNEFGVVRITNNDPDVTDLLSGYAMSGFA